MRIGDQQKKIIEFLTAYPNSTILELGQLLRGKMIVPGAKEYNSICRTLHLLETQGLVEKESSFVRWHIKSKAQ